MNYLFIPTSTVWDFSSKLKKSGYEPFIKNLPLISHRYDAFKRKFPFIFNLDSERFAYLPNKISLLSTIGYRVCPVHHTKWKYIFSYFTGAIVDYFQNLITQKTNCLNYWKVVHFAGQWIEDSYQYRQKLFFAKMTGRFWMKTNCKGN